ncbi:hypothetical protein BDZ45DRAFT_706949 [Acephala macrosclerotiorum]|nr:hypothetical protein BDZ45DRAFT_706949 [Acephala macrosclerotiorum]
MAAYKEYKDELSPRDSRSVDNVEMQERDDDYGQDQEERLLPGEDAEAAADIEYKVEWHLRTGWAIAGSIIAAVLVFLGLVLFTKFVIVGDRTNIEEPVGIGSFRRPASDYVLDHSWNFNAAPQVREYKWTVVDIVGNPDGVFREMITINGQFPGPMIECNEGDTIVIDVDNQSVNATAIHFHGLYQNGTNHMDGTSGITQCPISPGKKFRYEFTVSGQSGTYYYHGHQAVQMSDGLYGPLVIHGRDEKNLQQISYVSDRVVMLQDYYHDLSSGLLVTSLEPGNEASPIPNGALINGLNKRDCSVLPNRMCDNSTAVIPSFDMAANAYHRLRFINVGAFAWFQVSIDEHQMAITEADGTDLLPTYDSRMMISPAQRYSAIVYADSANADSFWLRARMVTHCWKNPNLPGHGADEVKAILRYTSRTNSAKGLTSRPTSTAWSESMEVQCKDMNTTTYVPAAFDPAPVVADHSYYLRSNLEIGDWRLERGFFNTSTFRPNLQQPTLHRTVDGLTSHNETFDATRSTDGVNSACYDQKNDFVIQHSGIKVVDLIIQNFDEGNHPMHLHGHKFWVLGQGHGMFPGYDKLGLSPEGKGVLEGHHGVLGNLIRRDVATAEGFGWLALRFIADNPGVWAFHCHMAWHSEAGLVMQFISRVDQLADWTIPEENQKLCESPVEDLEKGAAPKDSMWFGFGISG